jgi:hypothetical protein
VAGFLHGELAVYPPPVGVIDRVHQTEQVHGLVDAPVFGEGLPERGGMPDRGAEMNEYYGCGVDRVHHVCISAAR